MEKMSFKGWAWPQNPEVFQMSCIRTPNYKKSSGVYVYKGLSDLKRTFSGNGVFLGSTAFADFQALAAMLSSTESGVLVHPVWGTFQVYFTELEMTQEPRENEVSYRFEFREADSKGTIPK